MSKGLEAITAERESQFTRGYSEEHDSHATQNELMRAASAHLEAAFGEFEVAAEEWPWDADLFHVNTPVSSLAKAGALLAAEIDRRFAAGECTESDFAFVFPKEVPLTHRVTLANKNMGICGQPVDKTQRATFTFGLVTCPNCKAMQDD